MLDYSIAPTAAPTFEALTPEAAKAHCRVWNDDDDAEFVDVLIPAAREQVEKDTRTAIVRRAYRLRLDAFPAEDFILLPRPPLVSVTTITYVDPDGATQTWSSSNYTVDANRRPGAILLAHLATWPLTRGSRNDVTIDFVAGPSAVTEVPPRAVHAMKLLIGHWYQNREAVLTGTISGEIGIGYERLCAGLRAEGYP